MKQGGNLVIFEFLQSSLCNVGIKGWFEKINLKKILSGLGSLIHSAYSCLDNNKACIASRLMGEVELQ